MKKREDHPDDRDVYKLTDEQRASIAKGIEDLEAGRVKTSEEADKAIDELLRNNDQPS